MHQNVLMLDGNVLTDLGDVQNRYLLPVKRCHVT